MREPCGLGQRDVDAARLDALQGWVAGRVAELPRNPAGKVLKRELREPYWKGFTKAVN